MRGEFSISINLNSELEENIFRLLSINNVSELKLTIIPSREDSLDKWAPILIIDKKEIIPTSKIEFRRIDSSSEEELRRFMESWFTKAPNHHGRSAWLESLQKFTESSSYIDYQNIWNEKFSAFTEEQKKNFKYDLLIKLQINVSTGKPLYHKVDSLTKETIYSIKIARDYGGYNVIRDSFHFYQNFIKWLKCPQED